MAENIDNLMLEHMKKFQASQDRIERKIEEVNRRLSNIEAGQATVIQHLGHLAAADASQQLTADGFNERLERIERRLEIAN